jgi:hypothetical protein
MGGHIMRNLFVFTVLFLIVIPISSAFEYSFGVGLMAGYHEPINSRDSYQAVYDSGDIHLGLVGDYRMFDNIALDIRVMSFMTSGYRVTIDSAGQITQTNHPEDLHILAITAGARWFFMETDTYSPYAGLAVGNWWIDTESTVGNSNLKYSNSGIGAMLVAGVQMFPQKKISYGFDLSYSVVPNMIGDQPGTVSHFYNDSDIGGLSASAMVQFRF